MHEVRAVGLTFLCSRRLVLCGGTLLIGQRPRKEGDFFSPTLIGTDLPVDTEDRERRNFLGEQEEHDGKKE